MSIVTRGYNSNTIITRGYYGPVGQYVEFIKVIIKDYIFKTMKYADYLFKKNQSDEYIKMRTKAEDGI